MLSEGAVPYRTRNTGRAVETSMICREWQASAPTDANQLPHGDHVNPVMPTVWKPEMVLRLCLVVAFQTITFAEIFDVCVDRR